MKPLASEKRRVLDEDLMIIRATLATIVDDVRKFSGGAADAIKKALEQLDRAQGEFSRLPEPK